MSRTISPGGPLTAIQFEAGPRKYVLLESNDDQGVFQIWFRKERDKVEFGQAENCHAVLKQVREAQSRDDGHLLFGIIDRDYTPEDTWQEEMEPHCFRLYWHELENYLLAPEALHGLLETTLAPNPAPTSTELAQQIQAVAKEGLARTAASWILVSQGKSALRDGGKERRETVVAHLAKDLEIEASQAEEQLRVQEEASLPLLDEFQKLHTVVEGKRLFHWFKQTYCKKLDDQMVRNLLAREQAQIGVPEEIRRLVEQRILGATK